MSTATKSTARMLQGINDADKRLQRRFAHLLEINHDLDRALVSFQANRSETGHRWCKYKEGFSARLVRYILEKIELTSGRVLDPFAGAGTTLFIASERGLKSVGIELLPSSAEIIEVRKRILSCDRPKLAAAIRKFKASRVWERPGIAISFKHLRITVGAFPSRTEFLLGRYLFESGQLRDSLLQRVLVFAALCVLESVSYTRKDGQYLRWDTRSGRRVGAKPFHKGPIRSFTHAIVEKLSEISDDLAGDDLLFDVYPSAMGDIQLMRGSCLDLLPTLRDHSFDGLVTSPPYCNRYDYTRTYALELAMLGIDEAKLVELRQAMLSCTVENKQKTELRSRFGVERFSEAMRAFESQELVNLVIRYLDASREEGALNNNGIPRMVRGYFTELALMVFESARLLKPGARMVMVNDNVRYHGAHVPVDLILSEFAERAGFQVERIWVLPRGKGNSSQQMGAHGRQELRKCVYIWRASGN